MDFTGRPNGYRDYLATVKDGPWYDWKKNSDGTYHFADIKSMDGTTVPTEDECKAGLKAMQDAWDLENDSYKSKRRAEYPSIADQLDDIYHNGIDDWKNTIKSIKDKYPKE